MTVRSKSTSASAIASRGGVELIAHLVGSWDLDAEIAVDEVLHQLHRVFAFVVGLPVKVFGELRQVVIVEMQRRFQLYCCVAVNSFPDLRLQERVELCFRGCCDSSCQSTLIAGQKALATKVILIKIRFS